MRKQQSKETDRTPMPDLAAREPAEGDLEFDKEQGHLMAPGAQQQAPHGERRAG